MKYLPRTLFIGLIFLLFHGSSQACSMYKFTAEGQTMVGCNHDAWQINPKIWFENATLPNEYGAAFTGARVVSNNRTTPQSGMNTKGLVFSRLTSYYPTQENPFSDRLKITDEAKYLSSVLHHCASIDEVKSFIEQYDHSFFLNDVFIYIDSLGDYLIVEPYQLIEGHDAHYVLANFCPSITSLDQAREIERYRSGEDFLNLHDAKATLSYCTALSDTMHVSRSRNGDGTLLTSIWNTTDKVVNVFFYHDYDSTIQYDLAEELAKGDHSILLPEQFPDNPDYTTLVEYKTPFNTVGLRYGLLIMAALLFLLSLMMLIANAFSNQGLALKFVVLFSVINLLLIAYLAILTTNKSVFYFDVPYQHHSSSLISASSYIPFLLIVLIGPLLVYTFYSLKSSEVKAWLKSILVVNNLLYLLLISGFAYWGLFNFWN